MASHLQQLIDSVIADASTPVERLELAGLEDQVKIHTPRFARRAPTSRARRPSRRGWRELRWSACWFILGRTGLGVNDITSTSAATQSRRFRS
jgi:hypothetical protein